jgi:ABC-type branched-subunit amino acid transport system ATPase component
MALLELHGVVGGYVEGIDILNGVQLTVEGGSLTGIIGPNGSGKSTLLKTVFGFLHPRGGRIVFDGRDIHVDVPHVMKRLGIGYVPQGTNTFPQLTVHENLQLGASRGCWSAPTARFPGWPRNDACARRGCPGARRRCSRSPRRW